MTRTLSAELLKLRTTRTAWGFLIAVVALTLLFHGVGFAATDFQDEQDLRLAFAGSGVAAALMLVLGVVGTTGEHRHGTITGALLANPNRRVVVGAKLAAYALTAAVLGLAAMVVTIAAGIPWLELRDVDNTLTTSDYLGLTAGGVAVAAISGAIGVAVGSIVRSQVAAVVGILVYMFVLDPLVAVASEDVARFTIGATTESLAGAGLNDDRLTWWVGGLVLLGWTLVLSVAGMIVEDERDVV